MKRRAYWLASDNGLLAVSPITKVYYLNLLAGIWAEVAMCEYTKYYYSCKHQASEAYKSRTCSTMRTGHYPPKKVSKTLPDLCYKCKQLESIESGGDDDTDSSGQSEEKSAGGYVGQETWYIEMRVIKDPAIFTNLDPFGTESLHPNHRRRRREKVESFSAKFLLDKDALRSFLGKNAFKSLLTTTTTQQTTRLESMTNV